MNRWGIFGLSIGSSVIGLILTIVLWYFMAYAVYLWITFFAVASILPLVGGIIQLIGFHNTGGILMLIGGLPLVLTLIGVICIIGAVMAFKNGKIALNAKEDDTNDGQKFKGSVKIRTGIVEKVVLALLLVVFFTIPSAAIGVLMNEPLIHCTEVDLPDDFEVEIGSTTRIEIYVVLENVGMKVANGSLIDITITTTTTTQTFEWQEGDIEPDAEKGSTIEFKMTGDLWVTVRYVEVEYDGTRMHHRIINEEYGAQW